jgi:hypothetical protein
MNFPTSERDADAQLASARRAAYAWLRATLATLPAAVTSISIGAVLDDDGDRPTLAPQLRAEIVTQHGHCQYPAQSCPDDATAALYDLDDDLRTHTAPFLFVISDEEWLTVTRADLAPTSVAHAVDAMLSFGRESMPRRWINSKNTAPTMEELIIAAITQAIRDIPNGTNTTLRFYRDDCGHLTWTLLNP